MNNSKINSTAFSKYKNFFAGKSAVVYGTGYTLQQYIPIQEAIHLGCNRCLFYDKLIFDFYFFNDWSRTTKDYQKEILNYKPKIEKFFGTFPKQRSFGCNQSIAKQGNAVLYDMEGPSGKKTYQTEIDKYYMGDAGQSTVFVLMQFALFCGFSTIYIVGCDINNLSNKNSSEKYFFNSNIITNYSWYAPLKKNWELMKDFILSNYRDVKIISINPIGLKGLFEDVYQ
jgi:hypothetical protein